MYSTLPIKLYFMHISYFDLTVPVFVKRLTSLKHFLHKGIEHAKETGITEEEYLNLRLSPDMFPLARQVQITTDNAKGTVARLAGVEPLKIEDTETTFAELEARIDIVIAHLESFTEDQFTKVETRKIELPYFEGKYFIAKDYLTEFALPNFYFHLNMAYAIIRTSGVPLGKPDYLGALTMHDLP